MSDSLVLATHLTRETSSSNPEFGWEEIYTTKVLTYKLFKFYVHDSIYANFDMCIEPWVCVCVYVCDI
jgi:hypothetical protein